MVPAVSNGLKSLRENRQWTQEAVASRFGMSKSGYIKLERGERRLADDHIAKAMEVYGVPASVVLGDKTPVEPVNATIVGKTSGTAARIPLYGQAVGGLDGEFVLNGGSKLADVLAPPGLASVSGAYAVTCSGDSMEPRYLDGEIVFVHPKRRPTKGDFVVAQIHNPNEGAPPLAYIKRLVRYSEAGLVLEQYNPAKEMRFDYQQVISVHVIVGSGERLLDQW